MTKHDSNGADRTIRVLLVDNDTAFLCSGRMAIRAAPSTMLIGVTSLVSEVLPLVKSRRPDLVLLSTEMPRIDAVETARWVRALGLPCKIVLVSPTRDTDSDLVQHNATIDGVVGKSDFGAELARILRLFFPQVYVTPAVADGRTLARAPADENGRVRATQATTHWEWLQDTDYRFTLASGPDATLADFTPQQFVGRRLWELPDTSPVEGGWGEVKACFEAHTAFEEIVLYRVRRDGQHRYFSVTGEPKLDHEGRFAGYRGTARDCTKERISLSVVRQPAPDTLNRSMVHDLRNQVTAIQGFTQMLTEVHAVELSNEARECAMWIAQGTNHLCAMIDAVRELGRLARETLAHEVVDIAAMVRDITTTLSSAPGAHSVTVKLADLPSLKADAKLLRIALHHLIENAWKFTARAANAMVEIGSVRHADGTLIYYVRDNGIGFPATAGETLFQPFKRLVSASRFPGVGIGLSIVKHVIERHGGRVWAEGRLGQGAEFSFTL